MATVGCSWRHAVPKSYATAACGGVARSRSGAGFAFGNQGSTATQTQKGHVPASTTSACNGSLPHLCGRLHACNVGLHSLCSGARRQPQAHVPWQVVAAAVAPVAQAAVGVQLHRHVLLVREHGHGSSRRSACCRLCPSLGSRSGCCVCVCACRWFRLCSGERERQRAWRRVLWTWQRCHCGPAVASSCTRGQRGGRGGVAL